MGMCLPGFTQSQTHHPQTKAVEQSDGRIQGHEALPTATSLHRALLPLGPHTWEWRGVIFRNSSFTKRGKEMTDARKHQHTHAYMHTSTHTHTLSFTHMHLHTDSINNINFRTEEIKILLMEDSKFKCQFLQNLKVQEPKVSNFHL